MERRGSEAAEVVSCSLSEKTGVDAARSAVLVRPLLLSLVCRYVFAQASQTSS
jgi:hypothetical protein